MHEVESMAYAGATPWHGIGTPVTDPADAVSPDRFLVLAGLDWKVDKIPVVTADTNQKTTHFATRRTSDGSILGVVGPAYTVLQNSSVMEWFRPFLESGKATLEAGGSLRKGAIVWALAKIVGLDDLVRENDRVTNYILLSHGHDGMHSVRIGFTPTRVVCANTLAAAKSNKESQLLRLRHTAGLKVSMERVRDIMDLAETEFRANMTQYQLLASTGVNEDDIRKYVQIVIGVPETAPWAGRDKLHPATKKRVDRMVELAFTGRGNKGESLWDAYNGVTEYLSYEVGKSQDSRLRSLWFGDGDAMSRKALDVGIKMAVAA